MNIKLPKMLEFAVLKMVGYEPICDEEDEDEDLNPDMIGDRITNKTLKQVEDDWVNSYIIN